MRSSNRDAAVAGGTKPDAGRGAVIGAGAEGEDAAATADRNLDTVAIGVSAEVSATSDLLGEVLGVTESGALRLR